MASAKEILVIINKVETSNLDEMLEKLISLLESSPAAPGITKVFDALDDSHIRQFIDSAGKEKIHALLGRLCELRTQHFIDAISNEHVPQLIDLLSSERIICIMDRIAAKQILKLFRGMTEGQVQRIILILPSEGTQNFVNSLEDKDIATLFSMAQKDVETSLCLLRSQNHENLKRLFDHITDEQIEAFFAWIHNANGIGTFLEVSLKSTEDISRFFTHITGLQISSLFDALGEKETSKLFNVLTETDKLPRFFNNLSIGNIKTLINILDDERVVTLFENLNCQERRMLITSLDSPQIKRLYDCLDDNQKTDLLESLDEQLIEKLIRSIDPEQVEEIKHRCETTVAREENN